MRKIAMQLLGIFSQQDSAGEARHDSDVAVNGGFQTAVGNSRPGRVNKIIIRNALSPLSAAGNVLASSERPSPEPFLKGEAFLLTVRAFLITLELLYLQSVEVLLRHTSPL